MSNIQDTLSTFDKDRLLAAATLLKAREAKMAREPLYKHSMNNIAQQRFRNMTSRYRVLIGGNKVGKTDEMGFELVAMCKDKCEEFGIIYPHKPPLNIWYCGRDRNVLSDEPLNSIKRYLKGEGIDYKTTFVGNTIHKMEIWDEERGIPRSQIWFKPYSGDKQGKRIFESSNVHAVFMDEEPPREVFSAIKTKIGVLPGYVFIAMTPDNGMTWTYDLFEGTDIEHGNIFKSGAMQVYRGTVFDNMRNFKNATSFDSWVRYPIEYIEPIPEYEYKTEDGVCYVRTSDTFAQYIADFTFASDEYLYRILGQYISFTGKVYPFNVEKNTFGLSQLPAYDDLIFMGGLDYGYSDACCYILVAIDKTNTKYILDGFYESYLDSRQQARKIKEINEQWGVKPLQIVADNQIDNRLAQADAIKVHVTSIKGYYMDELGEDYTIWRTEALDKKEPHIKRDWVIKDLKDGKLKFLGTNYNLMPHRQEMARLEFKGTKDKLKGKDDHFDATIRMFYGASIDYETWAYNNKSKKNKGSRFSERKGKYIEIGVKNEIEGAVY